MHRGGLDFGVFAQLELVSGLDVALGGVQKVDAEDRVIRADADPIDALLGGVAEDKFAGVGVYGHRPGLAAGQAHLGAGFRAVQSQAECLAGLDEQLAGLGVGGVEPLGGIGDEYGERDAQGPIALKNIEADPDQALAAKVARKNKGGLGGIGQGNGPSRGLGGVTFLDLDIVETGIPHEGMRGAPVDDGRSFHAGDVLDPVGVDDMDGQDIALGPDRRRHIVQHHEIEAGAGSLSVAATASSTLAAARRAFSRNRLPRVTSRTLTGLGKRLTIEAWLSAAKSSLAVKRTVKTPSRDWFARKTWGEVSPPAMVSERRSRRRSSKSNSTSVCQAVG